MADTEIRVEVRTEGAECIALIVRPDTGESLGEAIADRGGRITGWAEVGPGESVPGQTIPPSERN